MQGAMEEQTTAFGFSPFLPRSPNRGKQRDFMEARGHKLVDSTQLCNGDLLAFLPAVSLRGGATTRRGGGDC